MVTKNNNIKAGDIETMCTAKGVEFYAYNHSRGRSLHIGTLAGEVYEKGSVAILLKPEPSISLAQSEYGAARNLGASFLRFVTREGITYSIGIDEFEQNKASYFNQYYGPQWRVPLVRFQGVAKKVRRNAAIDNPRQPVGEFELPRPRQLGLFEGV